MFGIYSWWIPVIWWSKSFYTKWHQVKLQNFSLHISKEYSEVIFIINESLDHLLNQLIHRLAWGYWGFELTLYSEDLTARLQISFHVYLSYYIRSTYVYQMCLYKHKCFMRLTEDFSKSRQTSAWLKCPWTRHWIPTSCRAAVQSLSLASHVPEEGRTKTQGINQYKGTQTSPGC